jgi:hypothetical protein
LYKIKKEELDSNMMGIPLQSEKLKAGRGVNSAIASFRKKQRRLGDYEIIENQKGFWSVKQT